MDDGHGICTIGLVFLGAVMAQGDFVLVVEPGLVIRPLTLEVVQPELRTGAAQAAGSSLTYGLLAVVFSFVPFLVLVLPVLQNPGDATFLRR